MYNKKNKNKAKNQIVLPVNAMRANETKKNFSTDFV